MNYKENLIKEIDKWDWIKHNINPESDVGFTYQTMQSLFKAELKGYETAQKEFAEWLEKEIEPDIQRNDLMNLAEKVYYKIKELKGEK